MLNAPAGRERIRAGAVEQTIVRPVTAWAPQVASAEPIVRYETVEDHESGSATVAAEAPALAEDEATDAMSGEESAPPVPAAFGTVSGAGGGLHVVDAQLGPVGSFRLQLALSYFTVPEFLRPSDEHDRLAGALSLGWVPYKLLELYFAIQSQGNSNLQGDPELLQVLGDVTVGGKFGVHLLPWLAFGFDGRLSFLNPVGDTGFMLTSTGVALRALLTADLRVLSRPLPLLLRANLGYQFDNSQHLIERTEAARADEFGATSERAYLSRIERFGLGINRVDRLTFGLGIELPVEVAPHVFMHPLAELAVALPVNRQGYDCQLPATDSDALGRLSGPDSCLTEEGLAAIPSTVSVGLRLLPPVPGLSFLLAADVGLGGVRRFVRELAANAPYNLWLGVSYGFDSVPGTSATAEEQATPLPWLQAPQARIDGLVVSQGLGIGIADAVVRYPGRELSAQLTDTEGRFVSYALPPGPVEIEVSHPDYEARTCVVHMPSPRPPSPQAPASAESSGGETPSAAQNAEQAGGAGAMGSAGWERVPARCELVSQPRDGALVGHLLDVEGQPVSGASVELSGALSLALVSDQAGDFRRTNLPRGVYQVRIDAKGFLLQLATVEVPAGGVFELPITLQRAPAQAQVQVARKEVRIRRQIQFGFNSADIDERSYPLLMEVADVLLRNPQLRVIEIQGHTDNVGDPEFNRQLSEARAAAVRDWLVEAGVGESRLVAKGYGDLRPLLPNITDHNRAMNRRVQFIIRVQD